MKRVDDDFQLEGQMSIFDFPEVLPDDEPYIDRVKRTIKEELGIDFCNEGDRLIRTCGQYSIQVSIGHYSTHDENNGRQYISVGYHSTEEGASCPCDSLEEAVKHVKSCLDTVKEKNEKKKAEREAEKQKKADARFAEEQRQEIWNATHLTEIEPNGILPCDECGAIPRIEQASCMDSRWTVVCECGMESVRGSGRWVDLSDTKQEAIDHWNKGYRNMNVLYRDKGKRSYEEMFNWDFDSYKDVPHMLSMFKRVLNKETGKVVEAYYQIERVRAGWQKPYIQVNEKRKGYISVHQYPTVQALVEEWDFPELEQWAKGHYEG